MKKALITGVTGQDGSYLAEFLLEKEYKFTVCVVAQASCSNTDRIDHLYKDEHEPNTKLYLHYGDMTDTSSLLRVVKEVQPDEIYNLAAQSHIACEFRGAKYTANSDALGALRLLDVVMTLGLVDKVKFYQASTSELYGLVRETPQTETTPFILEAPMQWPSFMPTGSRSTIGRHITCMPATAFCSIMSHR